MASSDDSDEDALNLKRHPAKQKFKRHPRPHPYKIEPIALKKRKDDRLPVKGRELIAEKFPGSVMLCAKTFSGKTTVEKHIIDHTTDERTAIIIFCSTVNTDAAWIAIVKDLRSRGYTVEAYDSIYEEVNGRKSCILPRVMKAIRERAKARRKRKRGGDNEGQPISRFFVSSRRRIEDPNDIKPVKPPTTWVPPAEVIFDDLPINELRSRAVETFMKQNRHDEARVMMSIHSIVHTMPSAMNQFSMVLVWDGFSRDYIDTLHDRVRTTLTKDQFWVLYQEVTSQKYSFLNINMREKDVFRHNFDEPPIPVEQIFSENDDA